MARSFRFVNFVWITAAEARDWAPPFIRNWSSGFCRRGICEIVLYTLHHKAAEGFYQRQGMTTSQDIVYMTKKLK